MTPITDLIDSAPACMLRHVKPDRNPRPNRGRTNAEALIFSDVPEQRLVTIRRGGTLKDADHHLLAMWPADCREHDEAGYAEVRVRGLHG